MNFRDITDLPLRKHSFRVQRLVRRFTGLTGKRKEVPNRSDARYPQKGDILSQIPENMVHCLDPGLNFKNHQFQQFQKKREFFLFLKSFYIFEIL